MNYVSLFPSLSLSFSLSLSSCLGLPLSPRLSDSSLRPEIKRRRAALSHTLGRTEVTSCQNNSLLQQELVCSVRQRLNFNFGTYRFFFHIDQPPSTLCVCVCVHHHLFGPVLLDPGPESERGEVQIKSSEDSLDVAHHTERL